MSLHRASGQDIPCKGSPEVVERKEPGHCFILIIILKAADKEKSSAGEGEAPENISPGARFSPSPAETVSNSGGTDCC